MVGDGYALVLHGDADASKLGGTAICGFSSTGMVGVIAASHIIRALDLEQMGTVLDENFPAMALVQESIPKHPVRVYQGEDVGVFTSEIQFPDAYDVKFAETVLKWFVEGGFDRLIIIVALIVRIIVLLLLVRIIILLILSLTLLALSRSTVSTTG